MSVGSVLMLTSVGWGYFANNSIPKLELAAGVTKITRAADLKQRYDWASAIGSHVLTTDDKIIGTKLASWSGRTQEKVVSFCPSPAKKCRSSSTRTT
jgi:hypothetical protein